MPLYWHVTPSRGALSAQSAPKMKIHGGLIECFFSVVGGEFTTTTSDTTSFSSTTDIDNSYSDQQHQIWVVGSSPTITNEYLPLPATWHVTGSGHKNDATKTTTTTKSTGAMQTHRQTDVSQWYREKVVGKELARGDVGASEPLQVRLSGNMIVITSATGGIANHNAIKGWQQQTIDGLPQGKPSPWTGDAYPLLPLPPIQWDIAWSSPHFGHTIQKTAHGVLWTDAAGLCTDEGRASLVRAFLFQLTTSALTSANLGRDRNAPIPRVRGGYVGRRSAGRRFHRRTSCLSRAPHCGGRFNKSGSLAMLAAIRRASSRVSTD